MSIAALLKSVPLDGMESCGIGATADRGSTKLLESRGDGGGGGALFSSALSRFNSSDKCYSLAHLHLAY